MDTSIDICPACGLREIEDEELGFCHDCAGKRLVDHYLEDDDIDVRRQQWAKRTASTLPQATRERQRRHRLHERLKPSETAQWADPLELGKDALHRLEVIRRSLGAKWSVQMRALAECDEVEERIKQLAWGPVGIPEEETETVEVGPLRRRIVIVRPRKIKPLEGQQSIVTEATP